MALVEQQVPEYLDSIQDDSEATGLLIADIKNKVAKMRQLQADAEQKEEAARVAKRDYEDYKDTVVVASMQNAGVYHLEDEYGNYVKLKSTYYCNPNKNDQDRIKIAAWVKEHSGEHLLKHEGKVDSSSYGKLLEAGIPFADKIDINTNSLKSFLQDMLGFKKGSIARISIEDIPAEIHFFAKQEVEVG